MTVTRPDSASMHCQVIIVHLLAYAREGSQRHRALQNGFVPPEDEDRYNDLVQFYREEEKDDPEFEYEFKGFEALASYSSWFYLHPEKIAGTPVLTKTPMFPILIEGDATDVQRVFAFLDGGRAEERTERMRRLERVAVILLRILRREA